MYSKHINSRTRKNTPTSTSLTTKFSDLNIIDEVDSFDTENQTDSSIIEQVANHTGRLLTAFDKIFNACCERVYNISLSHCPNYEAIDPTSVDLTRVAKQAKKCYTDIFRGIADANRLAGQYDTAVKWYQIGLKIDARIGLLHEGKVHAHRSLLKQFIFSDIQLEEKIENVSTNLFEFTVSTVRALSVAKPVDSVAEVYQNMFNRKIINWILKKFVSTFELK